MSTTILLIIFGLFTLACASYLVYWASRYFAYRKALHYAEKASRGLWSVDTVFQNDLEQALEYARLIPPTAPAFEQLCLAFAQRRVQDPRCEALLEKYLATHAVNTANAPIAGFYAREILHQPLDHLDRTRALNAGGLFDRLSELQLLTDEDQELRSGFAQQWIDVSPGALAACLHTWRRLKGQPQAIPLLRFLNDQYAAAWELQMQAAPAESPVDEVFLVNAAEVFSAHADLPPANQANRKRAILASHQAAGFTHEFGFVFTQCDRAYEEFGPRELDEQTWLIWAQAIIDLEKDNWPAFGNGHYTHLPADTSPTRLREIFDRVSNMHPQDDQLWIGRAWANIASHTPITLALGIYQQVLERRLPVAPALEKLLEHAIRGRDWLTAERAARALVPLAAPAQKTEVQNQLVTAIVEGNLSDDHVTFESVFDHRKHPDPGLNGRLARYYFSKNTITGEEAIRLTGLLEGPFPDYISGDMLQELRRKLILAWLRDHPGEAPPEKLIVQATQYLEGNGSDAQVMKWAMDAGIGSAARRQSALEVLITQRPVERSHCLELGKLYTGGAPELADVTRLAEAAESVWKEQKDFMNEDVELASWLFEHLAVAGSTLSARTLRKLLTFLIHKQPAQWRPIARRCLERLLEQNKAEPEILRLVLDRMFKISEKLSRNDRDPLHTWCLERWLEFGNATPADHLRLLMLYDAGVAQPAENGEEAVRRGQTLARRLASRCRAPGYYQAGDAESQSAFLFPLLQRTLGRDIDQLADWELDFFLYTVREGQLPNEPQYHRFAEQLVSHLLVDKKAPAAEIQRWLYENGPHTEELAGRTLEIADNLNQVDKQDPFWFDLAVIVRRQSTRQALADNILQQVLLETPHWDKTRLDMAMEFCETYPNPVLSQALVDHCNFPTDNKSLDRLLVELVNQDINLGKKQKALLVEVAERRERRRDIDGALQAYWLAEDTIGSSEDLARRILHLLPDSPRRQEYAPRLEKYLQQYRNSYEILAPMVTLARDPARPLNFDLALRIVRQWGDLAGDSAFSQVTGGSQEAGFAHDPSFVALTKCEIYDLYHTQLTPEQARQLLESIGKHARQALSPEARRQVHRLVDEALTATGTGPNFQDAQTRQVVATILYNLGDLPAAVNHFEQLVEDDEYRQPAVEAMKQITRQLESTGQDFPALLTAYRVTAEYDYQAGRVDLSAATLKKAQATLLNQVNLEELSEDNRRRVLKQRDPILKLYQALLENRRQSDQFDQAQLRELADVYRLRGLWDLAGRLYSELALDLRKKTDRQGALECAELVFSCYYKAGKGWWDPAARYIMSILWNREAVPLVDNAASYSPRELHLIESIAVMYHSLYADRNLHLDPYTRNQYKRTALLAYGRLSLEYRQGHEYINQLEADLKQASSTIVEPFDLVPSIREQGQVEIWKGTRYERLDRLGEGAFAEVFKVRDTQTNEIFAMKLIIPAQGRDPKVLERFQREGAWLKEIDHPNIVKCFDAGVQEDRQYIIMDFVDGMTLDDLITRRRRELPVQKRLEIFLKVCSAVEYLHSMSLLHRDLHPGNVLVGGRDHSDVKLTDFGLATMMDREGVGKSSRINGRVNYTPPEVVEKKSETPASEVFSLGAMLCFVLVGYPYPDAALLRELNTPLYFNLGEIIERSLSIAPQTRYQHVTELIQAIRDRTGIQYNYGDINQRVTRLRFQQMFEMVSILGQGDAGTVYRAHDRRTLGAPDVAIKEISSDRVRGSLESRAEHFYRVRDLQHPNLVPLQAFFRVENQLYIVMDLADGGSLAGWMEDYQSNGKRFTPLEIQRVIGDVANGLAYVHAQGIVHACVTPANVLLTAERRARLSDFTASVLFEGDQWHKSARVREYDYYLAPEIESGGDITPRSDVYSLGWLLCHMLTGRRGQLSQVEILAALDETGQWDERQLELLLNLVEGSTALAAMNRKYINAGEFEQAFREVN